MRKTKTKRAAAADRYLWYREDALHIWFRMAVPRGYRAFVPKPIILESLGTADAHEARKRRDKRRVELIEEWDALRRLNDPAELHVPSDEELEEAAVIIAYEWVVEEADEGRRTLKGKGPHMWRGHLNLVKAQLEEQMRLTATDDYEMVEDLADAVVRELNYDLPRHSDGYERFCKLLNSARLAALEVIDRRNEVDPEAESKRKLVRRVHDREASTAREGETILDLFEIYGAERVAVKKKSAKRASIRTAWSSSSSASSLVESGRSVRSAMRTRKRSSTH